MTSEAARDRNSTKIDRNCLLSTSSCPRMFTALENSTSIRAALLMLVPSTWRLIEVGGSSGLRATGNRGRVEAYAHRLASTLSENALTSSAPEKIGPAAVLLGGPRRLVVFGLFRHHSYSVPVGNARRRKERTLRRGKAARMIEDSNRYHLKIPEPTNDGGTIHETREPAFLRLHQALSVRPRCTVGTSIPRRVVAASFPGDVFCVM
jgi:hypothetical protein